MPQRLWLGAFDDEATGWTDGLLLRLRNGDRIIVPAHWPTEISNGLLMGVRRKSIKPEQPAMFWDELARLPIASEPALPPVEAKAQCSLLAKSTD